MAPTARLPPKKDVALALLEQASMYIHLDPRADTVQVPAWFKKQPQLVLQVGLNMAVRIPDLHVDEQGLSCTLSFNRSPFFCMIPWPAVFALVGENGQAMVWAEDVPAEVAAQAQAQKAPEKPRTHLRSVAADGEGAPAAAAPTPAEAPAPEKKPAAKAGGKTSAASGATARRTAKSAQAKTDAKSAPAKKGASLKSASAKPAKVAPEGPAKKPAPKAEPAVAKKPTPKPASAPDGGKPKRELPPYLRVVK